MAVRTGGDIGVNYGVLELCFLKVAVFALRARGRDQRRGYAYMWIVAGDAAQAAVLALGNFVKLLKVGDEPIDDADGSQGLARVAFPAES